MTNICCTYDLESIPVHDIAITNPISHDLIVGSPKYVIPNQTPTAIFQQIEMIALGNTITFGSFVFIRNFDIIRPYYDKVHQHTLFYYVKFGNKNHSNSFQMTAMQSFNVCLYIKQISSKSVYQWKQIKILNTNPLSIDISDTIPNNNIKPAFISSPASISSQTLTYPSSISSDIYQPNMNNNNPNDNNNMDDIKTQYNFNKIIDTPDGLLSISKLLELKFRCRKVCYVANMPSVYLIAHGRLLKQKEWFGKFGKIKRIEIKQANTISTHKSVAITFKSKKTTLDAITWCNNYRFDNGGSLSATFGFQKYCQWFFLSNKGCNKIDCYYLHSWNRNKPLDKHYNIRNDFEKEKLRKQIVYIAKHESFIQLNQISNVFQKYFKCELISIYQGNLVQLCEYFQDIFDIRYNDNGTVTVIVSKLNKSVADVHINNILNAKSVPKQTQLQSKVIMKDPRPRPRRQLQSDDTEYIMKALQNQLNQEQAKCKQLGIFNNDLSMRVKILESREMKIKSQILGGVGGKCSVKFVNWMRNVVKLPQYVQLFKQKEYDDVILIELLTGDILENDIGITRLIHCQLLLKNANEFKLMMVQLNTFMQKNTKLLKYKRQLIMNGILTMDDLQNDIKNKLDVKNILNVSEQMESDLILQIIHGVK